jgi:hypothetical protein
MDNSERLDAHVQSISKTHIFCMNLTFALHRKRILRNSVAPVTLVIIELHDGGAGATLAEYSREQCVGERMHDIALRWQTAAPCLIRGGGTRREHNETVAGRAAPEKALEVVVHLVALNENHDKEATVLLV